MLLRWCLCRGGHRGSPSRVLLPQSPPSRSWALPALTGIYQELEQVISAQSWLRESLLVIPPSTGSDGSSDFRRLIEPEQRLQTAPSARPGDGNFRANGLLSHQFKALLFFFQADNTLNILQDGIFLGSRETLESAIKETSVNKETRSVNSPVASQGEMFGVLFQSRICCVSVALSNLTLWKIWCYAWQSSQVQAASLCHALQALTF